MEKLKIWNVKYLHGVMPDTQVMAADEDEARRMGVAAYRFRSQMGSGRIQVVDSVALAENQDAFGGTAVQPRSEFPPEKPVVNADRFVA